MQFENDLIEKWNNNIFDTVPAPTVDSEEHYLYTSNINNTSAKLFKKEFTLSHNGNTVLRHGDILVGYQSNNVKPINVALLMNDHIVNTFTLTNNTYVPAFFSTHYLPIICLQYTDIKLVLINDNVGNNINIKLIYACVSNANRKFLAQVNGQIKLGNGGICLIESGRAKWSSEELVLEQLNNYTTYTPITNIIN
jgi:hypothetical protein